VAFISTLFDLIVIFIFMILFGVPFQIMCLFIPLIFLLEFLITLGVGLILSALFVRWRDLNVIWMLIQNILFWLLPIIYPTSRIPSDYQFYYQLNPLVLLIENFRAVVLDGSLPNFLDLLYIFIVGIILLGLGIFLFNRRKVTFAEEI
jgi:ABC-2 type transport system permease protein